MKILKFMEDNYHNIIIHSEEGLYSFLFNHHHQLFYLFVLSQAAETLLGQLESCSSFEEILKFFTLHAK